jgi:hypothetical protein
MQGANHDLIIVGQEVEAIGENALSVIYNQKRTFSEMRTLGESTRGSLQSATTAIVAAAGERSLGAMSPPPRWQGLLQGGGRCA